MTESDDYDFSSTENSTLSRLFEKDGNHGSGVSNLIYKAPKQPLATESKTPKNSTSKFFFKYINLYEIIGVNHQLFGKHIIALITSETNGSEMLIYQSKKNILIRGTTNCVSIHKCTKSFCLNLEVNDRKWLLEFDNINDFTEFCKEFCNFGGKIENNQEIDRTPPSKKVSIEKNTSLQFQLPQLADSSILDPVEESKEDSVDKTDDSKKEKEDILARLAKMGLPQLPTFQKEEENSSIMKGDIKTFSEKKSIDEVKNKVKVDKDTSHQSSIDEIGRNDIVAVKSFENCTLDQQNDRIQVLNTMREIDPMALVLAENRMNNVELRQHLSLLTLKLNEMTNSTKNEDKTNDKLKSQLRAYQLKTENLESELKLYQKNYDKLHKITIDLSSKLEESNSNKGKQMKGLSIDCCVQTDLFASEIELKAHFIQLLDLINRLSLNPVKVDLKELKNMNENIKDNELSNKFKITLEQLQENIELKNVKLDTIVSDERNSFIKSTKQIMSDLYSNIPTSSYESDSKNIVAQQIRHITSELIRNYDESVQKMMKDF